jgi:hypothetical protein
MGEQQGRAGLEDDRAGPEDDRAGPAARLGLAGLSLPGMEGLNGLCSLMGFDALLYHHEEAMLLRAK